MQKYMIILLSAVFYLTVSFDLVTAQGSTVDQQIVTNEQQLQQTNAQIQQINLDMVAAQNKVNQAQQIVNIAQQVVDNVTRIDCWSLGDPSGRKVCTNINKDNVAKALVDRNQAQANLNGEQQSLFGLQIQSIHTQAGLQQTKTSLLVQRADLDEQVYHQQYQAQVAVPYKNAITTVATGIVEYLATSPIPTTAEAGRQIVAYLNTNAQTFTSNLGLASKSSDALRQQLDREVENLVSQGSAVEQQTVATEQQSQSTDAQIQQTNAQLVTAQNQVNQAQQAVTNAINNVNEEQRKVDEAKNHCTFIGGKIGQKLCSAINHDGIDGAEGDRDRAQNQLKDEQQRLTGLQTSQTQLAQKQVALQQTKTNLQTQKTNLDAQLAQLNQARNNFNNVDTALKAVIVHVDTLFGKSKVLADVIKNLIDMETVIKPLTAIADQIISYTPNKDDVTYLNLMKQKISASLPLVQQKLPQYALIPNA